MPRGVNQWEGGLATVVFLVAVASLSFGNVLLKLGMDRWGAPDAPAGWAAVPLVGGVVLLTVQFFGMLLLFRLGWPVSVVVPLFGLNHALTALLGGLLLNETLDASRWIGIALVVLGIVCIGAPWVARNTP